MSSSTFLRLALSRDVIKRALKVAFVVGTLLALINHGDAIVSNQFAMKNALQVVLSYFVPYAVSTYSAVHALQNRI